MMKPVHVFLLLLIPMPAYAYVGPGVGLTAIGAVIAFLAAIFLIVVGFVWYPVKRFRQKLKARREGTATETESRGHKG